MDTENYLKEAVKRIVGVFHPDKIILFGSYAYGVPNADSDIDLLVVMDSDLQPHKRSVPVRKALRDLGIPKDVIVKTPDEFSKFKDILGTIVYTAAHKGRVLYER